MSPPDDDIGAERAPERPGNAGGKRVAAQPAGKGPDARGSQIDESLMMILRIRMKGRESQAVSCGVIVCPLATVPTRVPPSVHARLVTVHDGVVPAIAALGAQFGLHTQPEQAWRTFHLPALAGTGQFGVRTISPF